MITDSTTPGLQTDEALGAYQSNPAIPEHDELAMSSHGRVAETEVEVRRNPWITDLTDEDLVAQQEFGMWIRDQVDPANSAVIGIRGVKAQLDERLEAADDDETLIATAERGHGWPGSGMYAVLREMGVGEIEVDVAGVFVPSYRLQRQRNVLSAMRISVTWKRRQVRRMKRRGKPQVAGTKPLTRAQLAWLQSWSDEKRMRA